MNDHRHHETERELETLRAAVRDLQVEVWQLRRMIANNTAVKR